MRALIGIVLVILPFVGHASAQASSAAPGTIRGEVSTKGTNGEPAVMPGVLIIIPGPISKETELYAKGVFAVYSLPRGDIRSQQMLPASMRHSRWKSAPTHLPPFQSRKMWLR